MFEWKGAFLKGPCLPPGEARAGVKTCLSVLTWSQPRTEGPSSEEVFLGRARVKLSAVSSATVGGTCEEEPTPSSSPIATEMGGQRNVPWRSTMNLGLEWIDNWSISDGKSSPPIVELSPRI